MDGNVIDSKDEALKSQIAIRCAKAAILLSSLKCSPNSRLNSTHHRQDEGREVILNREIEDLKIELVRERLMKKKMKLCSVMELLLQITLLLSIWTLCLLFFFKFL